MVRGRCGRRERSNLVEYVILGEQRELGVLYNNTTTISIYLSIPKLPVLEAYDKSTFKT